MSEIFLNGAVGRLSNILPPTRAPLGFHSRLPGYAPTPLLPAHDLAAELGVGQLWLKHEADRFGLPAFKILGASWAIRCLLKERLSIPDDAWSDLDQLANRSHHPPSWSLRPPMATTVGALHVWLGCLVSRPESICPRGHQPRELKRSNQKEQRSLWEGHMMTQLHALQRRQMERDC